MCVCVCEREGECVHAYVSVACVWVCVVCSGVGSQSKAITHVGLNLMPV